ncbi:MAG: hypothetical protein Q9167_006844 [Letrouitia subvulpina]
MSRHKLVKAMKLDDELDDFDGGGYDDSGPDEETGLTAEDQGLFSDMRYGEPRLMRTV